MFQLVVPRRSGPRVDTTSPHVVWVTEKLLAGECPTHTEIMERFGFTRSAAYKLRNRVAERLLDARLIDKYEPPRANMHRISQVNEEELTAVCSVCGPVQVKQRDTYWMCCVRLQQTMLNSKSGRTRHGLTMGEAREFVEGKSCAICGATEDLVADHCHKTGRLREPLCNRHNLGLGLFQDSVEELKEAIQYIIKHEREHEDEAT